MDVAKVRDKVASGRKRTGKCDGSKIKNEERERRRGQMSSQRERGRQGRTTGEYTGDETRPDEMR